MERSKREMILDSALKMFVEFGFENSPTSKISKKAGVATGTLFHYFETKEELINELYLDIKRDMVSTLAKNLDNANTIRQKIETIWQNGVSWAINKPEGYKFFAMFGYSSYISTKTREEGLEKFSFIINILKQGIEEEILKDVRIDLMNEVIFSAIFCTAKVYQAQYKKLEKTDISEKAFSIVWDSIRR